MRRLTGYDDFNIDFEVKVDFHADADADVDVDFMMFIEFGGLVLFSFFS